MTRVAEISDAKLTCIPRRPAGSFQSQGLSARRKKITHLCESNVSHRLSEYFQSRGLDPLGKKSPFNHSDDTRERTFEIDLAVGPVCTLGNRNSLQIHADKVMFEQSTTLIDAVVEELLELSLFPRDQRSWGSWHWDPNSNPVYGLAVEIENNVKTKYFLGSLLAAAIAGRWGLLIVPDCPEVPRWIETIHRMMHKGARSLIPSNVAILSWPVLQGYLDKREQSALVG